MVCSNITFAQHNELPEKPFIQNICGKDISDPYSYLENSDDTIVQNWYKQNSIQTRAILDNIEGRKEIVQKLIELDNKESYEISLLNITKDNTYIYLKESKKEKTINLFFKNTVSGKEELLYNTSNFIKDFGENFSIAFLKPSWNNKFIALGLSKNGEETGKIVFLDFTKKQFLPEIISNCWPSEFGIDWLPDNSGIIYTNIPNIDTKDSSYLLNTEMVTYKIGDNPQKHSIILSKNSNPEMNISTADFPIIENLNDSDNYIISSLNGASTYNDFFYANIQDINTSIVNWKPLFNKEDKLLSPIIFKNDLYCLSSKNSPNFKIIKTNITNLNFDNAEIIVPELKDEIITNYIVTNDGLFFSTTKNGVAAKLYFVSNKNIKEINLPIKAGSLKLSIIDKYKSDLWVTIKGWLNPEVRYKYDVIKNTFKKDKGIPTNIYPEFKDFIVEEIEIPSHDGSLVPVSLIYKKGMKKNKLNKVLLSGYGAYGISMPPRFRLIYLTWVLNGGVFVQSHVRGGGEKGDEWHFDGYKKTKPNSWKDFIATAEYLIKEEITVSDKIAITSGSAGGILVGRAITERPDLFKVMICNNGLLNPLKIDIAANGPNSMKEFGDPKIKEECNYLYEMDSYFHLNKDIKYPSCLISVGMNDARVSPWMSAKFVSKLLSLSNPTSFPVLLKVDFDLGHGIDNSNFQLYNDVADEFAFALWQMGDPKYKLKKI